MRTIEQDLDTRELRRLRYEDRYLVRLEKLEAKAEPLVGEVMREGKTVYYVNLLPLRRGKVKESYSHSELVDYLIRNKYIS